MNKINVAKYQTTNQPLQPCGQLLPFTAPARRALPRTPGQPSSNPFRAELCIPGVTPFGPSAIPRGPRAALKPPLCTPPPPAPVRAAAPQLFPASAEARSPLSCGRQHGSLPRAPSSAAAGCTDRRGGQRMESTSLAGLSPKARFCTPAQAGDEAIAVLAAQQEFDPVPGPFGLQSSPFLILSPAQPRGIGSGMALAGTTARGCFARTPSKGRGAAGTPSAPSPVPPGQQGSASCCQRVMGGTRGICGRHSSPRASTMFLQHRNHQEHVRQQDRKLSQRKRGERKDFPSLQWVSPTLLALQHPLRVWNLPQI